MTNNESHADPNPSLGAQIDRLCDQFETAWRNNQKPRIEDYLAQWQHEEHAVLIRDLLRTELELKLNSGGEPRVEEYIQRFAGHGEVVHSVFAEHVAKDNIHETVDLTGEPMATNVPSQSPFSGGEAVTLPPTGQVTSKVDKDLRYFGDYELVEEIARGGMGVVYRARQVSLNRPVALKMILAGQFASDEEVQRFQAEAEAAAGLDHSGIVPIYEIGQHSGHHFFSMKLIEGESLAQRVPELVEDQRQAAALMGKIARAVHHAHQRGILHRDLKPGNVLIDEDGEPHITDFGLARQMEGSDLTRTGTILGTPSYMPPEQAQGDKQLTTTADVYSLGAILYELLTGQPPFRSSNPVDTVMRLLNETPTPPREINRRVDGGLELICQKCLEKDPNQRYGSAEALERDLERWLADEPISVRAPSMASLMRFWMRQSFGAGGWTPVIGLAFGLGFGVLIWMSTAQQNVHTYGRYYDYLPNAKKPWLLNFDWLAPDWMRVGFVSLGVILIGYLGFLTAVLVRPKNRSADFVAGFVTSLVAGFALFVSCIGMLGILSALDHDDHWLLRQAAVDKEQGMQAILKKYPDLVGVPADQRTLVLFGKIRGDEIALVPLGLWAGMFLSFVLCLVTGVAETIAAGPLVRKHTRWYKVLIPYSELGVAMAVLMFLGAAYLLGPLIMDMAFGVVDATRLFLLVASLCCAIGAALQRWHWGIRAASQVAWACFFVCFMGYDFIHGRSLGKMSSEIVRVQRLVEQNPDSVKHKLQLGRQYTDLGSYWYHLQRWKLAIKPYEEAIRIYGPVVASIEDNQARFEADSLLGNLAEVYEQLGRHEDALATLKENHPLGSAVWSWRWRKMDLRATVDDVAPDGADWSHRDYEHSVTIAPGKATCKHGVVLQFQGGESDIKEFISAIATQLAEDIRAVGGDVAESRTDSSRHNDNHNFAYTLGAARGEVSFGLSNDPGDDYSYTVTATVRETVER